MSRLSLLHSMPARWERMFERTSQLRWPRLHRPSALVAFVFAVCVFLLDWLQPASGTLTMLYVLSVAVALGSRRQETLINIGLCCVSFIVLGYFVGPAIGSTSDEFLHRGCAVVAVGLMSWIGWQLVESVETAEQLRVDTCLRQVAEDAATFFRSMVDHVPIGISRTDLSGRFVFVNEEFCRMLGVTVDDLLGRSAWDVVPQALAENNLLEERRVIELGQPVERIERVESISTNGEEQFMKVIRTPVKDNQGKVVGIQSLWLDVTELKTAELGLEQHAQNLERSNVDLQQFAYIASHDLQEPLRAVSSYCQLFEKHYASQLDERAIRWLQFAVNGAQHMQTLVRDLLTYARIDNKSQTWLSVNSQQACQQAIDDLSHTLTEAHTTVSVGELPIVPADATQLELLFQNLINNAVKFRGEQPPRVSISAKQVNDDWQFAVSDNGIGIKPEFHEKVFEIFKRLQSQDRYPGTGIGLAICKRIVERFGGKIWVDSQPDQGSTFFFTIPNPMDRPEVNHAAH